MHVVHVQAHKRRVRRGCTKRSCSTLSLPTPPAAPCAPPGAFDNINNVNNSDVSNADNTLQAHTAQCCSRQVFVLGMAVDASMDCHCFLPAFPAHHVQYSTKRSRSLMLVPLPCREETFETKQADKAWDLFLLKEPKFFNRWPLQPITAYLRAWDSEVMGDMLAGVSRHQVLLDGTPQYLQCPSAAARIKAAVPHAKFVIVVRVRFADSSRVLSRAKSVWPPHVCY